MTQKNKLILTRKHNRFHSNLHEPESLLFGTLPSFIQSLYARFNHSTQDSSAWCVAPDIKARSEQLRITWIGHATFLIQIGNINIITDPIFGDVSFMFRRLTPPGIRPEKLPSIDYVLISHNHRDHMDAQSLFAIRDNNPDVRVLVPLENKAWFDYYNFNCLEFEWYQAHTNGIATFTFLPANHWSQRGLFDKNTTLWGSWLLEYDSKKVYFAGDTAYGPHFKEIGSEYSNINYALLPVGPGEPHEWMKHTHMNSGQAIDACTDLQASCMIPMHWGTFPFGNDALEAPVRLLEKNWKQTAYDSSKLKILKIGESI